jgi:hypothetical protein
LQKKREELKEEEEEAESDLLVISVNEVQERGDEEESGGIQVVTTTTPPPPVVEKQKPRLSFNTFDLDQLFTSGSNFLMASDTKVFENSGKFFYLFVCLIDLRIFIKYRWNWWNNYSSFFQRRRPC